MIEAYSEQLITIDELRTRMPHLRAREASLRSQLDALDAQAADRDAYLKLAGDLDSFLAQLRGSAATSQRPRAAAGAAAAGQGRPHRPREDHHPPPHPSPGTGRQRRPPRHNRHGG